MSRPEDYELVRKIGRGRHSHVFVAVDVTKRPHSHCAIKVLNPTSLDAAKREIDILRNVAAGPNIVTLLNVVWESESITPSLVFEYVDHEDFRSLYPRLSIADVRHYVRLLARALAHVHHHGIVHADLRPHNVLINHAARDLRLIDFGSAFLRDPRRPPPEDDVRIIPGMYRAPELLLLLLDEDLDYAIDMWNLGVMCASIIFRREPFFHGNSVFDQLERIARVLGTGGLWNTIERYDLDSTPEIDALGFREGAPWQSFVNADNEHLATADAIDFVDRLLRWDHQDRLTAKNALDHPFLHEP